MSRSITVIDHPRSRSFNGVQVLRAFAASIVVALHASRFWSMQVSGSKELLMWRPGNAGVDIFFVISGFVMALTTARDLQVSHPGLRFLLRRAVRVYPIYWLCTLPWIVSKPSGEIWPASYVITSLLLLPGNGPNGPNSPINGVGWTLVYECFFYALVAAALGLGVRPLRLLTPLLILLAVGGIFLRGSHVALAVLASPLLLEFLAGMFLASLAPHLLKLPRSLLVSVAVAACAILLFAPTPVAPWSRALLYGVPAALLVGSFIGLENFFKSHTPRLALLLGSSSYVLYLIHILTLNRLHHLSLGLDRFGDVSRLHEFVYVLLIVAVASTVAIFVHKLIEIPLQKFLAGVLRRFEGSMDDRTLRLKRSSATG